jgi:hypothetical protein
MNPLTAELADAADAELQFAIHLAQRDGALEAAFRAVRKRIGEESNPKERQRLLAHVEWAIDRVMEERFQGV